MEEQDGWEIPSKNLLKGRKKEEERETASLCHLGLCSEEEKSDPRGPTYCLENLPAPHTLGCSLCCCLQWRTEVLILLTAGN